MNCLFDNKSVYIYGTGIRGIQIYKFFSEMGWHLSGFIDNYSENKEMFGVQVLVIKEVRHADIIILSALRKETELEMRNSISSLDLQCVIFSQYDFFHKYELPREMNSDSSYSIQFEEKYRNWMENILSEVDFWNNRVAKSDGDWNYSYESKYIPKEFKCERIKDIKLNQDDIILDVGCGLYSQYGRKHGNLELNIIGVDPLAFFYNKINKKYFVEHGVKYEPIEIQFGLFEALGLFFKADYADLILIDNALDHCIDPVAAIVECLKVLKVGGVLSTSHLCCEAIRENYYGLHQWNIYEYNSDLIIFSPDNYININKLLGEYAEIIVNTSDSYSEYAPYGSITCQITKKKELSEEILEYGFNDYRGRIIICETMKKLSDTSYALDILKVFI